MSRQVLVTGASGGIGSAIALSLAKDGFNLCIHYNKDEKSAIEVLHKVLSCNVKANLLSFDVTNKDDCKEKLEQYIEVHGPFYGIVLNAGINRDAAFPALSYEDWCDVINVDLNGFYNVINPLVMPMISLRDGGRIVTISSVSGVIGNRGQVNYSAAKAGLIGATKALAIELAKRKITVNCVAPGLIDTKMAKLDDLVMKKALEMIPLKRMGTAEEVAHAVSFLMSDKASYITRQVIEVNGGM